MTETDDDREAAWTGVFDVSVGDVMRLSVETTSPSTPARDVIRQLYEANVGSVVVVDEGELVGIVTDSDVLALVLTDSLDATTADGCSSVPVVTTTSTDSIETAAALLREHDIDQLPVVDDGSLVGIVSVRELSYYLPTLSLAATTIEGEGAYEDYATPGIDVGDRVRFTKRLGDADVRAFARASGDRNPLHLDAEYAAETRFGERIAHGVLTLGVVSAALARFPGLVVYLSQSARFVAPVAVGDRVTAVCEVVDSLGGGRFRLRTEVRTEAGEAVIDGEAVIWVVPTEPTETNADA